ncbi:MAG: 30S ribosomal protein S17 [Chloroflexi bacterium]|nr:30S ribosomal protein S17 [Chloroflexota bacterium]
MAGTRKVRVGRVLQTKMNKTIVVGVEWKKRHFKYDKAQKMVSRFYAHDEKSEAREGDIVQVEETRPLSKLKRWNLVAVVKKSAVVEVTPQEFGKEELAALQPKQEQEPIAEGAAPEETAPEETAQPA